MNNLLNDKMNQMEDIKSQISITKDKILELKNNLIALKNTEALLNCELKNLQNTYYSTNILPIESLNFEFYKPESFRLFVDDCSKCWYYKLEYDNYIFSINDRPDEHYPSSFIIYYKKK